MVYEETLFSIPTEESWRKSLFFRDIERGIWKDGMASLNSIIAEREKDYAAYIEEMANRLRKD